MICLATVPTTGAAPRGSGILQTVREHRLLTVFVLTYVIGFSVYGFSSGRDATAAYVVMIVGLALLVGKANARDRFTPPVLWSLGLWGCLHLAGGLIPVGDHVLYNVDLRIPTVHFDRLVHAFGFGAATFACWQGIRRHVPAIPVPGAVAFIVALAGLGVGAVNEVVEFAATHLLAAANVGGYQNTGWDLVYDTAGCAAAGLFVYGRSRIRGERSTRLGESAASMGAAVANPPEEEHGIV